MPTPKKPVKPAEPVPSDAGGDWVDDDIQDPHVPETVQGDDVDIKTATAAEQMAKLEPQDMWQISNPPIVYFLERHFPCGNGRLERETLTIRAGSYEEYQYKRGLFELEWEEKYERIAMAAEDTPDAFPPQQVQASAPPPPPQPPPPRQPQQQTQGGDAPYCTVHNQYYRKHEKDGNVWYSHQVDQKPDGRWNYCRKQD